MASEQQKTTKKRYSPLLWVILIIGLLSASVGGVAAYLSASSNDLTNSFTPDDHPTVAVNTDNSITVTDPGYAVYLRAAVVVNWKNISTSNLLAEVPVEGTDYTLTVGGNWFKHTDGFYYYNQKLFDDPTEASQVSFTPFKATATDAKASEMTAKGYTLSLQIAAQTVQAVGQTDGASPVDAVQDAWGISAATITGTP